MCYLRDGTEKKMTQDFKEFVPLTEDMNIKYVCQNFLYLHYNRPQLF